MLLDMPDREDMGSIAASVTVETPANRPPVNDQIPRHEFVESEFLPGCGRCDRCGGGPLAEIHQERVDPMERIATALERIAAFMAADAVDDRPDRLQQLEVQLAGCSTAALGGTSDPATPDQWGWSAAYADVLRLRIAYDELRSKVEDDTAPYKKFMQERGL